METVIAALERRREHDGSAPLLTWYGDDGTRVELSAHSFGLWVDKTANLIASMGFDDEPAVALPLLHDHPSHWTSMVWVMAVWQIGGHVTVEPREDVEDVDLAVIGPESPHPLPGVETVACSLHPWGAAFAKPPAGITDFHEVLSQPDVHWTAPGRIDLVCWRDWSGTLTCHDLGRTNPEAGRKVIIPDDPRDGVLRGVVGPLLGGGSSVLLSASTSPTNVHRIADQEKAELVR